MAKPDKGASRGPLGLTDLQGHTFVGGESSRRVLSALLGIPRAEEAEPGGLRLTQAAWVKERVEVTVDQGADTAPNVIVIERYHTGRNGLAHSESLNLWARNDGLPNELVQTLRLAARGPLGRLKAEQLAGFFAADPELGASRYEAPSVVAEARQDEFDRQAFLFNWGGSDMWYQFFATAEFSRARLEGLDILNRATSVNHCDRECLANEPHIPLRIPLTNFPWDDRVRQTAGGRVGLQTGGGDLGAAGSHEGLSEAEQRYLAPPAPEAPRMGDALGDGTRYPVQAHYTELTDYDVIMGGQRKLADVLDFAIDNLYGDMIFAHVTCIPAVTGEDVDAVIRKAQERCPVPILTLTMTPDAKDVIFDPILVEERKRAEETIQHCSPRAVNLIGFQEDAALAELAGLLRELGVSLNTVLLPTVQLERVKRLPLAGLHVIHPNEFWQNLYNQLLFDTRIASITPGAPYGYTRSVAWLRAVVAALGLDESAVDEVVARAWAPLEDKWERLRAQARQHRLGFVVGEDQIRQIADPATTWGVPLLRLLEEYGFDLDFMIYATGKDSGRAAAAELHKGLDEPRRHRIRLFQTPTQLQMLLASGPFSAVYTEHFFDFRLTRSGKAQFSLNVLERGFAGAVRGLARLLEICRLPLYQRYGRYMGEAFPWARDEDALASLEAKKERSGQQRREGGGA